MRMLLLAGAALLALSAATVEAAPITFGFTGGFQSFTAPTAGTYNILASGTQDGKGFNGAGGLGAEIGGNFMLTAGETLSIAVGRMGSAGGDRDGGGGGLGGTGGGGASFDGGANQVLVGDFNSGNGSVVIDFLSPTPPPTGIPEPASVALLGAGLAGLVALRRRR